MKADHWAKKLFKSSSSSSAIQSPQSSTSSSSTTTTPPPPAPASSTASPSPEFSPFSSCTGSVTSDPTSPTTASEPSKKQRPIFGFTVKNASVHSLLNLAFNSSTAHSISKSHHPSTTSLAAKNGAHIAGIGGDNHNEANNDNDGDDDPETTTIYYHPPGDTQRSEQEHLICKRDRMEEEQQRLREAKQQLTQRRLEILGCVPDARASSPDLHQTSYRYCTSLPSGQCSNRGGATSHALAFSERTSSRSEYERMRSRSGSLPSSTAASRTVKVLDPTSAHLQCFQQKQAASTTATYMQSKFDGKEGGERPWLARHSVDSIKRLRASIASMSKFGGTLAFSSPLVTSSHSAQDQTASAYALRGHDHAHGLKSLIAMETPCCPHNTPVVSGSLDTVLHPTLVLVPTTSMAPHGLMTEDASTLARMQYNDQGYDQLVKVIDNLSTTVQDLSYKMATIMDFTAGVYSPSKSSSSAETNYQEQHGGGIGSGFDHNFGPQTQHRGGNIQITQPPPLAAASCSQRMSDLSNESACYAQPPSPLSSPLLPHSRQGSASASSALWSNHRTRRYIVFGPHLLQALPPPPGGPLPSTPEGSRRDAAVPMYPASDQPPPPRRPPPPPPSHPGLASATRATASAMTHRSTQWPSQPLQSRASSTFRDNTNTSDEDVDMDMAKARTLALEIQHELELCQSTLLTLLSFSPPPPPPPPPPPLLPPLAPAHRLLNKIDHNMDPSHSHPRSQQAIICTCHTKDNAISSQLQDTRSVGANVTSTARTKHDGGLVKTAESATTTYTNTYNSASAPARPPRPPHVTEDLREMLSHIESRLEILQYEWPQLFATSQPPSPSSPSSLEGTKDSKVELSRGIEAQCTNSDVGAARVVEEKGQEMESEDGKKTILDKDLHRMVVRLQRELLLIQREHGTSIDF
ncbi:hypothetical protein BG011_003196 [Mortierella polycephala]|uniref:Uncharacterized protein n=1 Tax=Mortierella polycephala TaxID=41804 RepID=A0A9P6Q505_9FUNG|nr:hypothetical protein BG011_003196 [Mortierella polycephala]